MLKSDVVRLQHMLDAAQKAIGSCEGHTREDLDSEDLLSLAIQRLFD
jgi:uncharacterized protein with HEPN domain